MGQRAAIQEKEFFTTLRNRLGVPPNIERLRPEFPKNLESRFTAERKDVYQQPDMLVDLEENCFKNNMHCHVVTSLQTAGDIICEIVQKIQPEFSDSKHVVQHDHSLLNRLQLWKRFETEPVSVHTCFDNDPDLREKHEISCVGITAPEFVVASPAAVLQQTGAGQPRITSLLPSCHVAVVLAECIVAKLEDGYAEMTNLPGNNFTFISGPSKTADIEAQLVYGAHGPGEMHLIIVFDEIGAV